MEHAVVALGSGASHDPRALVAQLDGPRPAGQVGVGRRGREGRLDAA